MFFRGYHIISGNQKVWNIQKIPEATTCAHLQARKSCCKAIFLALTLRWCLPRSVNHGPNAGSEVQRQLHLFCVLMTSDDKGVSVTRTNQVDPNVSGYVFGLCTAREASNTSSRYLAISCNLVQSLQNGAKSTKFEKKTGKWCSSWLCFSPSLSLSIIIILKILIVIRFKSTKSKKQLFWTKGLSWLVRLYPPAHRLHWQKLEWAMRLPSLG